MILLQQYTALINTANRRFKTNNHFYKKNPRINTGEEHPANFPKVTLDANNLCILLRHPNTAQIGRKSKYSKRQKSKNYYY